MHKDTRRLTVAQDHLRTAYEEVTRAVGLTERSLAEQAAIRGRDQLGLVIRKLQDEALRAGHSESAGPVERALSMSRLGWQSLHDALNDWTVNGPAALDTARSSVIAAIEAAGTAETVLRERDLAHR